MTAHVYKWKDYRPMSAVSRARMKASALARQARARVGDFSALLPRKHIANPGPTKRRTTQETRAAFEASLRLGG